MNHDFGGYATKADIECSDGVIIRKDAFKHQDGERVPLVWQHNYFSPENVLGHAILENREDGVYARAYFNSTERAKTSRELIAHGDINSLSIVANKLRKRGQDVIHGMIREVSLVLAGANPGATIDYVSFQHDDSGEGDEAIIYTGLLLETEMEHQEGPNVAENENKDTNDENGEETVEEIFNTLSDKQKDVVYAMLSDALESDSSDEDEEDDDNDNAEHSAITSEGQNMTRNVFEGDTENRPDGGSTLTHSQIQTILEDGVKLGSFKEALLVHAEDYGITNIDMLFPDAKAIDARPEWITRKMDWVEGVLNGARKLPFSKIKSMSADLTHEEARAKGYIKGEMKKEQFFSVAKRETGPKTIYKKQKLDRDDIVDITDFDVVAWLWVEMNFMLREELARAILVGDGREIDDPDKIDEDKIRPIAKDDEFYTDVVDVTGLETEALMDTVLSSRDKYKGSGQPTAYMSWATMSKLLLQRDRQGRRLFRNRAELASELEVRDIVTIDLMEDAVRDGQNVVMILVNMSDYAIGSTRGGEITRFDDFDIDYNQHKYLIETRVSGALTKHKTAQVFVATIDPEPDPEP